MIRSPISRCVLVGVVACIVAELGRSTASAQLPPLPVAPRLVAAPVVPAKDAKIPKDGVTLLVELFIDGTEPHDKVRNQPCKIHAVKLDKETAYQIDLVGQGLDTYLRLLDADGNQLAQDDDSGGNLNARIRHTSTKGGLHYIVATTCAGGEGGYTLTVRKVEIVPIKVAAMNPVAANKPSEVKGQLTVNSPADQTRGVVCQVHSVALKANKTYVIDLESTDFDAYLRLETPKGEKLQEDDDSGGNLNSRIEYRVPADGNYRLVAMPLHSVNDTPGNYTLRVTEKE